MNYVANDAAAAEARALVESTGVACLPIKADVSDAGAVATMVETAERELGAVDLLVTCAAVVHQQAHTEMDLVTWHRTLAVNVDGTYHPVMALKDGMIERGYGRIVCISSIAALRPRPTVIAYSASKAAVIAFVRSCAVAFAPTVRVNCVAPGFVDTEILDFMDDAAMREVIEATPLKRLGKPEEIAEMVAFLLSDRSSFTTAQTVLASGGQATLP
jgi:3-oxoacyl-[acyl-carrier protein] reductase